MGCRLACPNETAFCPHNPQMTYDLILRVTDFPSGYVVGAEIVIDGGMTF